MTSSNSGAKAPILTREQQAVLWGPQLLILETEAQHLLMPWIALASANEIDATVEPKLAVKQWVCAQPGGSQRVWKAIAASDSRVWTDLIIRAGAIEGFRETVLLIREFQTQAAVPQEFVSLVVSRLDQSMAVGDQLHRCTFYPAAVREARAALAEGRWDRFVEEFDLVDPWWAEIHPWPDSNQRKAGWGWLVKWARLWHEQQTRQKHARNLMAAVANVIVNGIEYRALTCNYELWRTSVEMRNCLTYEWYADGILQRHHLIVAGYAPGSNKPVIVLQLAIHPQTEGLTLSRARGIANRELTELELRDANVVRTHFEAQVRSLGTISP